MLLPQCPVLGVRDGLQPGAHVGGCLGGDADVGEFAVGAGAVPMLGVRRADDHVAGTEDLDRLAPDLVIADTSRGQQDLSMGVAVPTVSATGSEGDIVHAHIDGTDLVGAEQLGQPHGAGEVGSGGVGPAGEDFRICHNARIVPPVVGRRMSIFVEGLHTRYTLPVSDNPRLPRPAAKHARRRIIVLIVLSAVVAGLACFGYSIRDRFYFGTDPRALDHMYVSIDGGFGTCEDFPIYRIDFETALIWDGTCVGWGTPGQITVDSSGQQDAEEEGFTESSTLNANQIQDLREAVRKAHVDVWETQYGSNDNCYDAGGWSVRFVYTNGDVEGTTVETCSGGTPPRADILWSAINAII